MITFVYSRRRKVLCNNFQNWFNEFKVEYVVFFPFLLLLNNNDKFLDDDGPKICFTPQTFELSKKYLFS